MFVFYILYSKIVDKYYVGHTGDEITERLRKHNANHRGFTGNVGDWVIVHTEIFTTKEDAYRREREVKNWKSRKLIEKLVGSGHPD
jgi:putative endonuclease